MDDGSGRSPVYKVVAFAFAGLIVVAAAVLLMVLAPALRRTTPTERLLAALQAQFPGSKPEISGSDTTGHLTIALSVPFDPTMQAKEAYEAFDRVAKVAEAQKLEGTRTLEVTLVGTSLEGNPASVSRTLDYQPAKAQSP